MKYTILILALIISISTLGFAVGGEVDSVLVDKSEKKIYLLSEGKPLKEYDVVFGENPKGHKQQEGDERTPEGKYILDYRKADSSFYKAIHISYPNEEDKARARKIGVDPGGLIMIHGQKNGFGWLSWLMQWFNWTDGCIAVTNAEMDEIWKLVEVGTPIEIRP
ncbi:MAG: L,D-transpeptidase family protein [Gammaproteobacteria bacterium]|nr:L,D-transpeptidase family protein [Gammaproteobacteria bacterium]MCF6260100.1 L,D-transpeptidase family protein [Gammaproteobacteria bacterium]